MNLSSLLPHAVSKTDGNDMCSLTTLLPLDMFKTDGKNNM